VICSFVCVVLGVLPAEPLETTDLDGEWLLESWISDGTRIDPKALGFPDRLVVIGGRATLYVGERVFLKDLKYDITKGEPKVFSVKYLGDDPELKSEYKTKNVHGIYTIADNKLVRCYTTGDRALPKEFRSIAGSGCELQAFRRATPVENKK
jgi:uncharacterized protein (TIGR03067 family)